MMKVAIINASDSVGGAAKAARRLHRGLRDLGVDSRMLVQRKETADDAMVTGRQGRLGEILAKVERHLDGLAPRLWLNRKPVLFSPALWPGISSRRIRNTTADLLHFHWTNAGFLGLDSLPLVHRPVVWTLHDMWAFTGGCHHAQGCQRFQEKCGMCPVLGSVREHDLSQWVWNRKKRAWRDWAPVIVAPSRWLARCALASSLFRDRRIEVIPNGIDLRRFRPSDKAEAKRALGLSSEKKLIMFGAMNAVSDPYKGFHLLVPALKEFAANWPVDKPELYVFGSSEPPDAPELGLNTRYLGRIDDERSVAQLYVAADVFIAPSTHENLPWTIMEASACGTPCVAFDVGGISDLIEHERTGYLARASDSSDLAHGLGWVLQDDARRQALAHNALAKIKNEFELGKVARRYAALYDDALSGWGARSR